MVFLDFHLKSNKALVNFWIFNPAESRVQKNMVFLDFSKENQKNSRNQKIQKRRPPGSMVLKFLGFLFFKCKVCKKLFFLYKECVLL